jgi:hypothetical protein
VVNDVTTRLISRSRVRLEEARKSIVAGWLGIAEALEHPRETILVDDVRHFTRRIHKVLTYKEQQALEFKQQTLARDQTAAAQPTESKNAHGEERMTSFGTPIDNTGLFRSTGLLSQFEIFLNCGSGPCG